MIFSHIKYQPLFILSISNHLKNYINYLHVQRLLSNLSFAEALLWQQPFYCIFWCIIFFQIIQCFWLVLEWTQKVRTTKCPKKGSKKFEKFTELWHRTSNISNFTSQPKARTKRTPTPQPLVTYYSSSRVPSCIKKLTIKYGRHLIEYSSYGTGSEYKLAH